MTRKEAIKGLKVLAKDFSGYKPNEEMFDMAIKALEQPECEDAVSRFEVLRLIDYSSNDLNDSVDNWYFQGKVKELPSVTPKQPGWIPTSERLPEEDTPVLICSTEEDKFYHSVAVGWYCGGEWHCWDDRYGKGDVNAWMELPTPYREGGQS